MVFYEYNLPRVLDLAALAGIAVRLVMPASSREPQKPLTRMCSPTAAAG
jgi:hypothetical protein